MQHQPSTPSALNGAVWRKASRSQGSTGNCVELAAVPGLLAIRDSKKPHGPTLALSPRTARYLVATIKDGAHDL